MLLYKQKKSAAAGAGNRLLISVTVLGSAGPIRLVVGEKEMVGTIIDMVLKFYAREGRLPVLGSNASEFILYCPIAGAEAMSPWDAIGSYGVRNFMLFKKPSVEKIAENDEKKMTVERKGSGSWKEWFNRSLSLKVSSH